MSTSTSEQPLLLSLQSEGSSMPPQQKAEKDAPRRTIQEITGKDNFVEAYREAVRIKHNMKLSDVELVCAMTENWGDILKAKDRGEFSQTDVDQMKSFLEEKRPEATKLAAHTSIDFWIDMLEGLLSAHRASSRIEELLETLSLTKPQQFSRASTLFQILNDLPKVAGPDWVDPTIKADGSKVKPRPGMPKDGSESLTYIQMNHSFVYTSKGIALLREDVVGILSRDMKIFKQLNRGKKLHERHILRLRNVVAAFRVCEAETKAWKYQQKINALKMKDKTEPKPSYDALYEPASFMALSEAYQFVARLAEFYESHKGAEFEHARTLLRDLRRELHKELILALADTDFCSYAPS